MNNKVKEITKLLEEQKSLLETIINTVPIPIFYKDKNLRYIDVNDEFVRFLGFTKEQVRGKTTAELYPESLSKKYHDADLELLNKPGKQTYSYKIKNAKGEFRDVEFYKSTFTDKNGEVVGIVGAFIDVHEKNKILKQLEEEKRRAEEASVAKSRFLSNMSHEIRTPLNAIIGFINLLMNTELNDEQKKYLKHIRSASDTLMSIISDVLDFSRIEAGEYTVNIERVDLFELLDNLLDIIKYGAFKKRLDLIVSTPANLPKYIYTDGKMVKQILLNLLSNAIKFTKEGFVELSVEFSNINDLYKFAFFVRDTGIGIKKEILPELFKPFVQGDSSYSRRYGGTGLGLSISKKLADVLKGDIAVSSEEGKGSEFCFYLPVEKVENVSDMYDLNYGHSTALIFSEENRSSQILMRYLNNQNIDTDITSDQIHLFNLLLSTVVDYLFIDEGVVLSNDQDFWGRLGNLVKNIPIIFLYSKLDDLEYMKNLLSFGNIFFFEKPITSWSLVRLLKDINENLKLEDDYDEFKLISIDGVSSNCKVLIVEDVDLNRLFFKTLLSTMLPNAEIIEAENGEQGVIKYKLYKPDIVFMDLQMPIMDGYEATKNIRDFEQKMGLSPVPIVAVTANYEKEEMSRCKNAGITDYLSKPVVLETLTSILQKYLDKGIKENLSDEQKRICHDVVDYDFYKKNNIPENIMNSMLLQAIEQFPEYIKNLKKFIESKDEKNVKAKAHKIKGAALSLGFKGIVEAAEFIYKKATSFDEYCKGFKNILTEWEKVESEVKRFLQNRK